MLKPPKVGGEERCPLLIEEEEEDEREKGEGTGMNILLVLGMVVLVVDSVDNAVRKNQRRVL